jgi:hypothetical protein
MEITIPADEFFRVMLWSFADRGFRIETDWKPDNLPEDYLQLPEHQVREIIWCSN